MLADIILVYILNYIYNQYASLRQLTQIAEPELPVTRDTEITFATEQVILQTNISLTQHLENNGPGGHKTAVAHDQPLRHPVLQVINCVVI